jgi:hypothetical protein
VIASVSGLGTPALPSPDTSALIQLDGAKQGSCDLSPGVACDTNNVVNTQGPHVWQLDTTRPAAGSTPGSCTTVDSRVNPDVARHKSILQSGISKPKVYTDGTVRYVCFNYHYW